MKLNDPQVIELLAQRYVLGTQRGAARRRFTVLLRDRVDARRAVHYWEERLTPLAWTLEPVPPSDLVWQRICRQLGFDVATEPKAVLRALNRWVAVAAALGLIAIVSIGGWWRSATAPRVTETIIQRVPEPVAVALVAANDGRPLWLARIAPDSRALSARVVAEVPQYMDKDYELWALTDAGVPVSLGLLPQAGRRNVTLADEAVAALAVSSTVAVSLEPAGGSPQATPTGPVLYTAALMTP